jgi:glycogen operon protein
VTEIIWLTPSGAEMTETEWNQHFARCLGVYLAGDNLKRTDRRGRPIRDDNFLVLFNAHYEKIDFVLPQIHPNSEWWTVLDTSSRLTPFDGQHLAAGSIYELQGRSLALLTEVGVG